MEDYTEKFLRDRLEDALSKVTDRQRDFFNRLYPKGVPSTVEALENAIDQCERTIAKNEKISSECDCSVLNLSGCGGTADTADLKSVAERHTGSNPVIPTNDISDYKKSSDW